MHQRIPTNITDQATERPWREYNSDGGNIFKLWRIHNGRDNGFVCVIGTQDNPEKEHANAKLIVQAVNEHAKLVSDKAALLAALKEIAERGPVEGYGAADALRLRLVATQSIARAAIDQCEVS